MLIDPAIPESRNLIFLVDGEHVVLTVEMGEQPMWLAPATLAALRQPGFLYTTLYRARRLHAETEDGVIKQAGLLADLRRHGRRAIFDLDVGGCTAEDMPYLTGAAVVIFNQVGFPGFAVDVVDVTGAGDTFGGTLTWCLAQGQPFVEALAFSVAAASRSVTIHGPRGGKASADDIRRWRDG
ncbi:carbohydrate kinase family protein [Mycoplana dimorpha]|uniref:PfkB family carbohydrate kinase n=1 Tax=Mycoplana dimorpha TaxID=28320 RepID=A0A2T5B3L3_MYCDI|nr:PfkB family carbohydrate kinase [Mycoplana dimorpha]PTM93558.1 pfkB family carbohydrate kinase [Mycoplana dimorpha]